MSRIHFTILGATAAAVVMLAATAAGADGPRSIKDQPAPVFSWTGFYLGLSGGVANNSTEWTNGNPAVDTGRFSDRGAMVGGTVGFNAQFGAVVFGVEGDWSWLNNEASTPRGGCAEICITSADWLATVRGRIGYLLSPSTLVYGTAGAAWVRLEHTLAGLSGTNVISGTEAGWVAGAGFETRLGPHWSVKGEYLHIDLGDSLVVAFEPAPVTAVGNRIDIFRAGLNISF